MPRAAARCTQAEIARAIRAAKAEGVHAVEIVQGCIRLVLNAPDHFADARKMVPPKSDVGEKRKVVL